MGILLVWGLFLHNVFVWWIGFLGDQEGEEFLVDGMDLLLFVDDLSFHVLDACVEDVDGDEGGEEGRDEEAADGDDDMFFGDGDGQDVFSFDDHGCLGVKCGWGYAFILPVGELWYWMRKMVFGSSFFGCGNRHG
jgi:hypothetical protein